MILETPLAVHIVMQSWIHLIDVHQNAVFEMGKNRWRARVTNNRCNACTEKLKTRQAVLTRKVLVKFIFGRYVTLVDDENRLKT